MLSSSKNIKFFCLLVIAVCLASCQQNSSENSQAKTNENSYFPADVSTDTEISSVQITVAKTAYYKEAFTSLGYYGNGPCWAQLVAELIRTQEPALMKYVDFNPEGDCCHIECETNEKAIQLGQLINKFWGTQEKFKSYFINNTTTFVEC